LPGASLSHHLAVGQGMASAMALTAIMMITLREPEERDKPDGHGHIGSTVCYS
jgi:hypothetical protein